MVSQVHARPSRPGGRWPHGGQGHVRLVVTTFEVTKRGTHQLGFSFQHRRRMLPESGHGSQADAPV